MLREAPHGGYADRSVQLEKTKNKENSTRKNKECYRTHCFFSQPAQIPPTTQG
jgi:hypothetical protein